MMSSRPASSRSRAPSLVPPALKAAADRLYEDVPWSNLHDVYVMQIPENGFSSTKELCLGVFLKCCGDEPYVDMAAMARIIDEVERSYFDNYYHNFTHATHVLLNSGFFVNQLRNVIPAVERLAMLFAALVHDSEHNGVANSVLCEKAHALAIHYNNQSVAENNSLKVGFAVLARQGTELLANFSSSDRAIFRDVVIELVLATDISDKYMKHKYFHKLQDLSESDGQVSMSKSRQMRMALLTLALRCADVGANLQSIVTALRWSKLYYCETACYQFQDSGGATIDKAEFHRCQILYVQSYLHSELLVKLRATRLFPGELIAAIEQNVVNNVENWQINGMAYLVEWEKEMAVKCRDPTISVNARVQSIVQNLVSQQARADSAKQHRARANSGRGNTEFEAVAVQAETANLSPSTTTTTIESGEEEELDEENAFIDEKEAGLEEENKESESGTYIPFYADYDPEIILTEAPDPAITVKHNPNVHCCFVS